VRSSIDRGAVIELLGHQALGELDDRYPYPPPQQPRRRLEPEQAAAHHDRLDEAGAAGARERVDVPGRAEAVNVGAVDAGDRRQKRRDPVASTSASQA
jgi:hypothetical protein